MEDSHGFERLGHAAGIEVGAFSIASDPQVNENMGGYTGEFSYRIYFYRLYDDLQGSLSSLTG
jgi:hypothetical protein